MDLTKSFSVGSIDQINVSPGIRRLMSIISDYAGLKETAQLSRKLDFVLKGLPDDQLGAWVDSIAADPAKRELPALVEDLNNHETYFFRDLVQMKALEQEIFPALVQRKINEGDYNIRIWSAACSSGEETYTLAMLLLQTFINFKLSVKLEGGLILPPHGWNIEINGTDISRQVIRKAKEGIYESADNGLSSFRNFPPAYMQYFTKMKEYQDSIGGIKRIYQVNDIIKSFVKFDVFNLMNSIPPSSNFDLVLCRNLMIYLHPDAQAKVELVIKRALRPGGVFMLSAVDKLQNDTGIETHREMSCVYYEKR
ncbi:Chemotaxis protein methyltransferase 1 [BD1-7 clade bacterium]|uniref:Chemotaxis protein methyltransferase 1 n=1 Tax=BD1-7 clade bacterium TaxID=2029982 RepID=A0A5S9MXL9_9GAMM|nr:Chemotaxis protein methyltransferase 1 [BD1-7 clade bacterium]CAA0083447.1 Chemotaxis protein methyltransferase 1 [BD1-7 clade bacterium]CAA0116566.1 Chemotaxis protein methyltransferase 1 [BD1-7 clade bacterium]